MTSEPKSTPGIVSKEAYVGFLETFLEFLSFVVFAGFKDVPRTICGNLWYAEVTFAGLPLNGWVLLSFRGRSWMSTDVIVT